MLSIWQKIMEKIVKSTKQQDDSRGKDAPSLPVLRAELQIPQPIIDRYDAGQHKNDTREWWGLLVDAATLVFAVLGFGVLYQTLCETRRAVNVAVESAHSDKRAWVGLGDVQILGKPTGGKPLGVKIAIKNSGESPAIHVVAGGCLSLLKRVVGDVQVPFSEGPDLIPCIGPKPSKKEALGGPTLVPGADNMSVQRFSQVLPETWVESMMNDGATRDMTQQEWDAIPAAPFIPPNTHPLEISLFFVGCVNYFDAFGEAHRTSFCYVYAHERALEALFPNGAFMACPQGNEAD